MILLDTNVISELMRGDTHGAVVQWLDRQAAASVWTTTVTEMEIRYGIALLMAGRRREEMQRTFEKVVSDIIEERVAVFDSAAARKAADLMALRKLRGHPADIRDTMIAGIALASDATVATRNVAHFADVDIPVVDPWAS